MRYILWRPEFSGPVLSVVNGNSPEDVFKSLGYNLNEMNIDLYVEDKSGYGYWVCGDDSVSEADIQDKVDAFADYLIDWCASDDPQLVRDSVLSIWKPLVAELGEYPLMNLL